MSYPPPPGRPPLVGGMPPMPPGGIPPPYMMNGPPPPLMPPMMAMQPMMPMHQGPPPMPGPPQIRAYPKLNPNRQHMRQLEAQGPPVTVFVGNITERAPDNMIRQILGTCGHVLSWKKVKGFGFCEFNGPEAGLRAVRILHDMMVGEKRLVAKVDAKTKTVLDEYKAEKRKRIAQQQGAVNKVTGAAVSGGSPLQDEVNEEEEQLDEESVEKDSQTVMRIKQLLVDYKEEMNNFEVKKEEEALEKTNKILDEADVEEEKRDLITREIGKFREIMKICCRYVVGQLVG